MRQEKSIKLVDSKGRELKVMIRDIELGWLAGIIDGEGCITAGLKNRGRSNVSVGSVECRITVQANSGAMIAKICNLLDITDIGYALELNRKVKGGTRPAHRVVVRRKAEVMKLLSLITPHLVVKAAEAELMMTYIARYPDSRNRFTSNASNDEKASFIAELREAKRSA